MSPRAAVCALLCLCFFRFPAPLRKPASSPVSSDAQAVAILRESIHSQGRLPSDSTASGSVSIIAGSETQTGSIQIETRGSDQSLLELSAGDGTRTTVFSRGLANDSNHTTTRTPYPLELAASAQSALFPLPLLSGILSSTDSAYQYVGLENVTDSSCHHIRTWNTYASSPDQQFLSSFTVRDIWIDANTHLPRKIAYSIREGSGAAPTIATEVSFSDYRSISGVLYPFQIAQSMNGTPWLNITISTVVFNTGLTDSKFSTR